MNNTGVIFTQALRDLRKTIIGWSAGLAAYALFIVVLFPFVEEFEELNKILEIPAMRAILGNDVADLTSPAGYLGNYFFLMLPLIIAMFVVLYGLNITAGEEERGTLDVLLSRPVPRWRLIVEKFAAVLVALAAIIAVTMLGFLIAMLLTPTLEVGLGDLLLAVLNLLPILVFMTALTLLLSTLFRSRTVTGGIVAAVIVGSYFLNTIAALLDAPLNNLRYASIFHYYGGSGVLVKGIDWGGFVVLLGAAGLMLALAIPLFQRRDVGV